MKRLFYIAVIFACLYHSVSSAEQCNTGGKFPNDSEPDCRGYIFCIFRGNGVYVQYNLTCPQDFVFSPLEQICTNVTDYKCLDKPLLFTCQSIGIFENPKSDNCNTYIACIAGVNDTITPRLFGCPQSMVFSPGKGVCVNETEFKCVVEAEVTEILDLASTNGSGMDGSKGNDAPRSVAIGFGVANLIGALVCLSGFFVV